MKNALVVGGVPRFINETIAPRLARYGITVAHHWSMEHPVGSKPIPEGTQLVVFFKDMYSEASNLGRSLAPQCKKLGIPLVGTSRKMAALSVALAQYGFEPTYLPGNVPVASSPPPPPPPAVAELAADATPLPTWIMAAIKSGLPVELTPEHEKALFEAGQSRTFTVLCRVTPADATRWLETHNQRNRGISQRMVNTLTAAFRRGEFQTTHQGLAFGLDGVLHDGQHRLWAIFNAEVTVDILVTFGEEKEALRVTDGGLVRKAYQNREILTGDKGSKRKVESATIIRMLLTGAAEQAGSASATYDENEATIAMFREGLEWAVGLPTKRIFGSSIVRGALAFAYKTDPDKVKEFATQVLFGENLASGMPAFQLRNVLLAPVGKGNRTIRRDLALKVLSALRSFLEGATINRIYAAEDAVAFFGKAHGLTVTGVAA